jgi:cell division protein FtsQ
MDFSSVSRSGKYRWHSLNSNQRPGRRQTRQRRNSYRKKPRSWNSLKKGLAYGFFLFSAAIILTGFSLLLVLGYQYVLSSPMFCIKDASHIQIEGLHRLTPAQILQTGRLGAGISLLAIQPFKIEKNLNQHPWIERAKLIRQWPDRLRIVIQEHHPIAIVHLNSFYYLNQKGVLFKALDPGDSHDLPVITGLNPENFQPREALAPPLLARLINLMAVLKKTPAPLNLENIAEIHVDAERGLTLYPIGLGLGLDIGFQGYSQKFANFRRLLPFLKETGEIQQVARINLNNLQQVLVSFKRPVTASP